MKNEPRYDQWKAGMSCMGAHDCPDPKFPNHHDALCECGAMHQTLCQTCRAIVCSDCSMTIL